MGLPDNLKRAQLLNHYERTIARSMGGYKKCRVGVFRDFAKHGQSQRFSSSFYMYREPHSLQKNAL
jgi:hypothetical protein